MQCYSQLADPILCSMQDVECSSAYLLNFAM